MCGRISRVIDQAELEQMYAAGEFGRPEYLDRPGTQRIDWAGLSRVQVAPTQPMLVTMPDGTLRQMRWGWAAPWNRRQLLINARGESAASKSTFSPAVRAGRMCLAWASGWFEWQKVGAEKHAHHMQRAGRPPIAMGCLWQEAAEGPELVIVTVAASSDLAHIHDRMPLIVHPSRYRPWLDGNLAPSTPPQHIFEAFRGHQQGRLVVVSGV